MEIIRTAAECSRFRACCFSSAALRIVRYSFVDGRLTQKIFSDIPSYQLSPSDGLFRFPADVQKMICVTQQFPLFGKMQVPRHEFIKILFRD